MIGTKRSPHLNTQTVRTISTGAGHRRPSLHTTRHSHRHTGESRYLRPLIHALVARAPGFRKGDEKDGNVMSCRVPSPNRRQSQGPSRFPLSLMITGAAALTCLFAPLPAYAAETAQQAGMGQAGLSGLSSFVQALIILLREGTEAVLIFAALWLVLKGLAAPRRAFKALSAGAVSGILASLLTAALLLILTGEAEEITELIEGLSLLTAAVVLLFVSSWLLGQRKAMHWKHQVEAKTRNAMQSGRLFGLFAIGFLVIFREGAETALFLQALIAAEGWQPIALTAAGAGALFILASAFMLVRFLGMRLPLRHFFMITAWALFALAIVYAGKGVHALQEYGLLAETLLPALPRLGALGVYPYVETLLAQGLTLLLGLALNARAFRKSPSNEKASSLTPAE